MASTADKMAYDPEFMLPATDKLFRAVSHRFLTSNVLEFCISPAHPKHYTNTWYAGIMSHVHAVMHFATDWILVPEFSDEGRLHWHGYLKLHKHAKFADVHCVHIPVLAKLTQSRIEVKKIRNVKAYLDYVFKDFVKTIKNPIWWDYISTFSEERGQPMNLYPFKELDKQIPIPPAGYDLKDNIPEE